MSKRIVIAGGGSGGHVYPALAIAQGLVEEGVDARDITFIGGRNSIEKTVIPQHGFVLTTIPGKGLNRSEYIKNIYHAFQLAYACIMLLVKFSRSRPLVIIGVGGYASMPALVAASILVIPRYVHEQNSYVGRTNRLACLLGAKMMTTWPETTGARKSRSMLASR